MMMIRIVVVEIEIEAIQVLDVKCCKKKSVRKDVTNKYTRRIVCKQNQREKVVI